MILYIKLRSLINIFLLKSGNKNMAHDQLLPKNKKVNIRCTGSVTLYLTFRQNLNHLHVK